MMFDLVQLALLLACVIALCAGLRNDAAEIAAMRAVAPRPLEESRAQLRDVEAAEAPRRVASDERGDDEPPTYAEIVGPLRALPRDDGAALTDPGSVPRTGGKASREEGCEACAGVAEGGAGGATPSSGRGACGC